MKHIYITVVLINRLFFVPAWHRNSASFASIETCHFQLFWLIIPPINVASDPVHGDATIRSIETVGISIDADDFRAVVVGSKDLSAAKYPKYIFVPTIDVDF